MPDYSQMSDEELLQRVSSSGSSGGAPDYSSMSDEELLARVNTPLEPASAAVPVRDKAGFMSEFGKAIPRAIGTTMYGAGKLASDFLGADEDNFLARHGRAAIEQYPSGVNSFADIGENPLGALGGALGNVVGYIGPQAAVNLGGKALAGYGMARTGAALTGFGGQTALAALPSYGGIRDVQDASGESGLGDKALALGAAGTVGAIENLFGVQKALGLAGNTVKTGRTMVAEEMAKTPFRTVGKQILKNAAGEGGEELLQNPIEQMAGYENPLTGENLAETAFGGVMGALGGGGFGVYHGGKYGLQQKRMGDALQQDGFIAKDSYAPADLLAGLEDRDTVTHFQNEQYDAAKDFDTGINEARGAIDNSPEAIRQRAIDSWTPTDLINPTEDIAAAPPSAEETIDEATKAAQLEQLAQESADVANPPPPVPLTVEEQIAAADEANLAATRAATNPPILSPMAVSMANAQIRVAEKELAEATAIAENADRLAKGPRATDKTRPVHARAAEKARQRMVIAKATIDTMKARLNPAQTEPTFEPTLENKPSPIPRLKPTTAVPVVGQNAMGPNNAIPTAVTPATAVPPAPTQGATRVTQAAQTKQAKAQKPTAPAATGRPIGNLKDIEEALDRAFESRKVPQREDAPKVAGAHVNMPDATVDDIATALHQRGSRNPRGVFARLFEALKRWDATMNKAAGAKSMTKQGEHYMDHQASIHGDIQAGVDGIIPLLQVMETEFGTENVNKIMAKLKSFKERAGVSQKSPEARLSVAWAAYRDGRLNSGEISDKAVRDNLVGEKLNDALREQGVKVLTKLEENIGTAGESAAPLKFEEKDELEAKGTWSGQGSNLMNWLSDRAWQGFSFAEKIIARTLYRTFESRGQAPKVVFENADKGKRAASFNPFTNVLTIYPQGQTDVSLIHELRHAVTAKQIAQSGFADGKFTDPAVQKLHETMQVFSRMHAQKYSAFLKDYKISKDSVIYARLDNAVEQTVGAFNKAKSTPDIKRALAEFDAYGTTDYDLQMYMKYLKTPSVKGFNLEKTVKKNRTTAASNATLRSVWDRYVNALSWMHFGREYTGEDRSVLEQFITASTELAQAAATTKNETLATKNAWTLNATKPQEPTQRPSITHNGPADFWAVHRGRKVRDLTDWDAAGAGKATGNNGLIGFGPYFGEQQGHEEDDSYGDVRNISRVVLEHVFEVTVENVRGIMAKAEKAGFSFNKARVENELFEGRPFNALSMIVRGPGNVESGNARAVRWAKWMEYQGFDGAVALDKTGHIIEGVVYPHAKLLNPDFTLLHMAPQARAVAGSSLLGSQDTTKLFDSFAPKESFLEKAVRNAFPTLWGRDPTQRTLMDKIDQYAADAMKTLGDKFPSLAAGIARIAPHTFIDPKSSLGIRLYKIRLRGPVTAASGLEYILRVADTDTTTGKQKVHSIFDYMDHLQETNDKPAKDFGLDQHARDSIRAAVNALKGELETAKTVGNEELVARFEGLKYSQMLTVLFKDEGVLSSNFGIHTPDAFARAGDPVVVDNSGIHRDLTGTNSGVFYPVYDSAIVKPPAGQKVKPEMMVHESQLGAVKLSPTQSYDMNHPHVMDKSAGVGGMSFLPVSAPQALVKAGKTGEELGAAFLNTLSVLANANATRMITQQMNSSKTGEVHDDLASLYAHLADERAKVAGAKFDKAAYVASLTANPPFSVLQLGKNEGKTADLLQRSRRPGEWVQVPNSPAYGDIQGKILHGPLWAAIQDATDRTPIVQYKIVNDLTRAMKSLYTVHNPATGVSNFLSNFTTAWLAGMSFKSMQAGISLYTKALTRPSSLTAEERQIMDMFEASGGVQGNWTINDIKHIQTITNLKSSATHGMGVLEQAKAWAEHHGAVTKAVMEYGRKTYGYGEKYNNFMQQFYTWGDNTFRLGMFMSEMARLNQQYGDTMPIKEKIELAGLEAKERLLDYDIDADLVKKLKQSILPFASFTYAAAGMWAKAAKNSPWKLAEVAIAYQLISLAAGMLAGGADDEDKEKRIRDKKLGTTWFGGYSNIRLPSAPGRTDYLELARLLPTPVAFKDVPNPAFGIQGFPSSLAPSPLLMGPIAAIYGVNLFTGKSIHDTTDSDTQKFGNFLGATASTLTPAWARKVASGELAGKPGALGQEPAGIGTRLASTFLFPLKSVDDVEAGYGQQIGLRKDITDFVKGRNQLKKQLITGRIDRNSFDSQIEALNEEQQNRLNRDLYGE